MNNKRKTITFLTILLSLLISGCCFLGKPPCYNCDKKSSHKSECPFTGCFMKAPSCVLKNKEKLALTAEQETKIKALSEETKTKSSQIKTDMKKISVDLKVKLMEDDFDGVAISSLIDKKFDLKKQIIKSHINSHAALLAILTPEQKAKFKEIKKDCKKDCCGSKGGCHGKGSCSGKSCD